MKWFRMYSEVLNDPKVQRLSPKSFKNWVNLLCLSSQFDGEIPSIDAIAFGLRLSDFQAEQFTKEMTDCGLLELKNHKLVPHNWEERQYKSDVSTNRVKAFRERKRNVNGNGHETFHETEVKPPQTQIQIQIQKEPPNPLHGCDDLIQEIMQRHPRKPGATLGGQLLAVAASTADDPIEFLRTVSRRHVQWCESEEWTKQNGKFVPSLNKWVQDMKHLDEPPPNESYYVPPRGPVVF